jgi:hypothetical protein
MGIYIITILAWLSHGLNVLTGGSRFYTFSARSYYCAQILGLKRWVYIEKVVDILFFFQPNHCAGEYNHEKHGRFTPV